MVAGLRQISPRRHLAAMVAVIGLTPLGLTPLTARADPSCVPAVILDGDRALIAEIASQLRESGISSPLRGCPFARVTIERHGDSIALSIVDPDDRRAQRAVGDPATAAVLIESLLAAQDPAIRIATAQPVDVQRDAEVPAVLAPSPPIAVPGALAMAAESSLATDRSFWFGVRASGCVMLGPACVGGATRFARDTLVAGAAEVSEASRFGADLLLSGELPIERDGFTLTPGVGLGVGWLHVRRDVMTDTVEIDTGGLRAEAHVSATMPLGRLLQLRLGASIAISPVAHTQPFRAEGNEAPGEPRGFARVELGLEVQR
jgi:hypothetical protein